MALLRRAATDRVHQRRCVACGCASRMLGGDLSLTGYRCPSCGVDLYTRPPRTYAEMEGLMETLESTRAASFDRLSRLLLTAPAVAVEQRRQRRSRAWGAGLVALGAAVLLGAAAWSFLG